MSEKPDYSALALGELFRQDGDVPAIGGGDVPRYDLPLPTPQVRLRELSKRPAYDVGYQDIPFAGGELGGRIDLRGGRPTGAGFSYRRRF